MWVIPLLYYNLFWWKILLRGRWFTVFVFYLFGYKNPIKMYELFFIYCLYPIYHDFLVVFFGHQPCVYLDIRRLESPLCLKLKQPYFYFGVLLYFTMYPDSCWGDEHLGLNRSQLSGLILALSSKVDGALSTLDDRVTRTNRNYASLCPTNLHPNNKSIMWRILL